MRVALYRVLYEQFLADSIRSIEPFFDEIIVLLRDRPWGRGVNALGEPLRLETRRLSWDRVIKNPKVKIVPFESNTPFNEITVFLNRWYADKPKPGLLMFIEPDHLWCPSEWLKAHAEFAMIQQERMGTVVATAPIELWKTPHWRVPQRETRKGCIWWPMLTHPVIPETGTHAEPVMGGMRWTDAKVHDLGFCVTPEVMWVKHELSMAFSAQIGDSPPNPHWYGRWSEWQPEDTNLGISMGHEDDIPIISPYDPPAELLAVLGASHA